MPPAAYIIHDKNRLWPNVKDGDIKAIVVVRGDAERAIRYTSEWLHLDPSGLAVHQAGKEEALLLVRDFHARDLSIPAGYEDWDCLDYY